MIFSQIFGMMGFKAFKGPLHSIRMDMHFMLFQANIISWEEYKRWRESGLAFCIRDESAYEFPNKTLASGLTMIKVSIPHNSNLVIYNIFCSSITRK